MLQSNLGHRLLVYHPPVGTRAFCAACGGLYFWPTHGDVYVGWEIIYSRFGNFTFSTRGLPPPNSMVAYGEIKRLIFSKPFFSVSFSAAFEGVFVCPWCESHQSGRRCLESVEKASLTKNDVGYYLLGGEARSYSFAGKVLDFGNISASLEFLASGANEGSANQLHRKAKKGRRSSSFPYHWNVNYVSGNVGIYCASCDLIEGAKDLEGKPVHEMRGCKSEYYVVAPEAGQAVRYFYSRLGNMICAMDEETAADEATMRELEWLARVAPDVFKFVDPPDRDDFRCPLCDHLIPETNKTILEEKSVAPYLALSPRE